MTPAVRMLIGVAAMVATPLAAQDTPETSKTPVDFSALSDKKLYALLVDGEGRLMSEPCTFGLPLFTAFDARRPGIVEIQRGRLLAEALCADTEQRYADGARAALKLAELTPDDPPTWFMLYFAERLEDADGALAVLRSLDGQGLSNLDKDQYFTIGRMLTKQGRNVENDGVALAWAEGGKFDLIDPDLHSAIAMRALRALARGRRSDLVDQLLLSITSPTAYIPMLTQRDYEPFWPQIEARAGTNLALIGAEDVRVARDRLASAPDDRDRFAEAANALHYNGQFEEAVALAERWRERAKRGAAIEEGDAWALNIQAYAYDSLGLPEKADAVFEELAKLDPDEHNWVVNFVINRAARLTGQGRWEQGLAATELARTVAEQYGSTFAKLIIASNRACAFERLGRGGEAAEELAFLRENWKEGAALAAQGLMCHGLKDEAAVLLLNGLRDDNFRETVLGAFQTDELDLFYTATILPQATDLPPAYPELAAELAKHMRKMPEAFIPQAALKRVALKEGAPR